LSAHPLVVVVVVVGVQRAGKTQKWEQSAKLPVWDRLGPFTALSSVGKNKEKWATVTRFSGNRLLLHSYRGLGIAYIIHNRQSRQAWQLRHIIVHVPAITLLYAM